MLAHLQALDKWSDQRRGAAQRHAPSGGWLARGLLTLALVGPLALAIVNLAAPPLALAAPTMTHVERHARTSVAATDQVTIIVLDMSGSMGQPGGEGSDPDGLRCSAADAFISLSGPGQFIGVVGLADPTGSGKAQVWAQPAEMQTLQARQGLIQTITDKSNNCNARGETPTYDSLSQAYSLLVAATKGGRSGSVILLTDGVPYPNQTQQTDDIIQQLIPKFSSARFPINTIALGNDPSVRPFLRSISAGTNGSFNDDVNPATGQPDPLQITPVFLRYFAALTNRTPKPLVAEATLNGGVTARNFSVSSLVTHLDVVVIKQDPSAQVGLTSPEGIQFTQTTSSVLVATDPYYAIFSIDGPTPGDWIVSINGGSHSFTVYGLVVSNLHLALTQPGGVQQAFPIDQPLALEALLSNGNVEVNGNYTVTGKLTAGSQVIQQLILTHVAGSGHYSGSLSLPPRQPSGTYDLVLEVTQGSGDVLAATAPRPINFEVFPTPYLLNSSDTQVTTLTTTVTSFDGLLQRIYSLPVVSWFSGLPLNNIPATPSAVVNGVVTLRGQLYANSVVKGSVATAQGKTANASVTPTQPGHFQAIFPAATAGNYRLTLNTSGSYQDSHGAFGPTQRSVTLTIQQATLTQEVRAWLVTAMYFIILVYLSPLVYRWFLARREGQWVLKGVRQQDDDSGTFYRFTGRRRHYFRSWFRPNVVGSDDLWGYPGIRLIWTRFRGTRIEPDGRNAGDWKPSERGTVFGKLDYKDGTTTRTIVIETKQGGPRERNEFRAGRPSTERDREGRRSRATAVAAPRSSGNSSRGRSAGGFGRPR